MAEIFPDMAGAFTGRVGNVSYYVAGGRNFARGTRAPKGRRREEMGEANRRFRALVDFGRGMRPAIRAGFPPGKEGLSGWNRFVRLNMGAFAEDGEGKVTLDFSRLALADGVLDPPRVELERVGSACRFSWRAEGNAFARRVDDAVWGVLLWLSGSRWRAEARELGSRGEDGTAEMTPPDRAEATVAYVFARSADGRKASPSVFLG